MTAPASVRERTSSYVMLTVSAQQYAVAAASVTEVVALPQLTRVPKMPSCIRGLMNLRGTVVPVIDLAEKLGFTPTEITARTCVVIVATDVNGVASPMGIVVDAVINVISLIDEE